MDILGAKKIGDHILIFTRDSSCAHRKTDETGILTECSANVK